MVYVWIIMIITIGIVRRVWIRNAFADLVIFALDYKR